MHRRRFIAAAGTALATVPVAGCAGGGSSGSGGGSGSVEETTSVAMVGNQFDPRNVHVSSGATVTWSNEDSDGHTITSASDNWSLDAEVADGESTQHTFESSGVYDAYCRFHGSADLSGMSMKIAVGDATIESPLGGGGSGDGGGTGPY